MPLEQALGTPFTHLTYIFNSDLKSTPFYQLITGTHFIWENLSSLLIILGCYLCFYTVLIFLNKRIAMRYGNSRAPFWICLTVFLSLFIAFKDDIFWMDFMRPLPVILFVYTGILIYRLFFHPQTPQDKNRLISIYVLTTFSLVLLFKISLKVQVQHYGFALALPGFLIFVAILIYEVPSFFKNSHGSALVISAFGLAFLLAHTGVMGWISFYMYDMKDFPIGKGRDRVYDFGPHRMGTPAKPYMRGLIFNSALEFIDQNLKPEDKFVTFPAAPMVNYISRRGSPIVAGLFNPGVLLLTGEDIILNPLKERAPDYIVLVNQDFAHFGARFFGRDYAHATLEWIVKNYKVAQQFGGHPFSRQDFGIQILKRKPLNSIQ
jgi:hypothetical protein